MKNIKKIISVALCLTMLTLTFAFHSFASSPTVKLSVVLNENDVTLNVLLNNAVDIEICSLLISYDSDVLEFVSSAPCDVDGLIIAHGNIKKESQLSCLAISLTSYTGSATLATYKLRIKDGTSADTTTLSLVDSIIDDDAVTDFVTIKVICDHNYEVFSVVAPTCTDEGYTIYKCSECNRIKTGDKTKATEHTYESKIIAPTCTDEGYTLYKCSKCNYEKKENITKAKGHEYAETIVAPTCTQDGYTLHKCTVCGDEYKTDYVEAHHELITVHKKNATLISEGYTGDTVCTVCGKTVNYGEYVPQTGIYGDVNFDGKISVKDARLILRYTAKLDVFSIEQQYLADIDRDYKITAKDARKALRISAKLETA